MSCSRPIDAAVLSDYWFELLTDSEAGGVEEHLLTCDECGARLREVIAIAEGVRKLAREGSLLMVVTDAFLQRAAEQGMRIRQYAPPAGGRVDCTVTAEDDLLIGRLAANLSAAKQIDLCICNAEGQEKIRLRDIPVHQGRRQRGFPATHRIREGSAIGDDDCPTRCRRRIQGRAVARRIHIQSYPYDAGSSSLVACHSGGRAIPNSVPSLLKSSEKAVTNASKAGCLRERRNVAAAESATTVIY